MNSQRKKTKPAKIIQCQICQEDSTLYSIGAHVKKQHGLDPNEYKIEHGLKKDPNIKKEFDCRHCQKRFYAPGNARRQYYCSDECRLVHSRDVRNSQSSGTNFLQCPLCVWQGSLLKSHFKGMHPEVDFDEVTKDQEIVAQHVSDELSHRMTGENNPWFNHGGAYSPFSKEFVGYSELSEEEKEIKIKGIYESDAMVNRIHNTQIKYYLNKGLSQEEAKLALSKRQETFSLEKCIERHGDELGTVVWEDRQRKWQETINNKPQEEIDRISALKSTKINYGKLWGNHIDSPGVFYIIKINNTTYKIGITSKSLRKRYGNSVSQEDIVLCVNADNINHAFWTEQIIKRRFLHTIIKADYGVYGWTEVLNNVDIDEILSQAKILLNSTALAESTFNKEVKYK